MSSTMLWLIIGFSAQACFFSRFLVQWIASERQKRSIIPMAFWYLSLAGGSGLLVYAIHVGDPVFILGQSMGALIYLRNIWLRTQENNLTE
ncbi:MAG: lipid-A-disaccharide synthase N-terminal domain-containing protein [Gammaproteobacteria bacterium]|nr:lipid-A-disaccharide synthase N-terminal domain-containing protein [Gammaproteobacteria bacterium]